MAGASAVRRRDTKTWAKYLGEVAARPRSMGISGHGCKRRKCPIHAASPPLAECPGHAGRRRDSLSRPAPMKPGKGKGWAARQGSRILPARLCVPPFSFSSFLSSRFFAFAFQKTQTGLPNAVTPCADGFFGREGGGQVRFRS